MNTIRSYHDGALCAGRSGSVFNHPEDVVADLNLSVAEKRAILASWASDACAVENKASLRRIESGAFVQLDDILAALKSLEGGAGQLNGATAHPRPHSSLDQRRHRSFSGWLRKAFHRNDDDDDPPPSPAAAMRLPAPLTVTRAVGSFAEGTVQQRPNNPGRSAYMSCGTLPRLCSADRNLPHGKNLRGNVMDTPALQRRTSNA